MQTMQFGNKICSFNDSFLILALLSTSTALGNLEKKIDKLQKLEKIVYFNS